MKRTTTIITAALLGAGLAGSAMAEDPKEDIAADVAKHETGSQKLAGEQDELSADVQDLIEEQTAEDIIKLLEEVEEIMAEVTTNLDTFETGGNTIAAETEVIEKIFEAAKKKSQQSGGT